MLRLTLIYSAPTPPQHDPAVDWDMGRTCQRALSLADASIVILDEPPALPCYGPPPAGGAVTLTRLWCAPSSVPARPVVFEAHGRTDDHCSSDTSCSLRRCLFEIGLSAPEKVIIVSPSAEEEAVREALGAIDFNRAVRDNLQMIRPHCLMESAT